MTNSLSNSVIQNCFNNVDQYRLLLDRPRCSFTFSRRSQFCISAFKILSGIFSDFCILTSVFFLLRFWIVLPFFFLAPWLKRLIWRVQRRKWSIISPRNYRKQQPPGRRANLSWNARCLRKNLESCGESTTLSLKYKQQFYYLLSIFDTSCYHCQCT